jgi:ribosomal protein L11 methyltransferase
MSGWAVAVVARAPEREAVATWLAQRTGRAVVEQDDGVLVGYAADAGLASALPAALADAFGEGIEVTTRAAPAVDWATGWRHGLAVRRIGRLVLRPSWLPAPEGAAVVTLDPETAFGSGEHGSTRTALRLLDANLRAGDRVLDLGTGSGVLAIAAARLGARWVVGIELDPAALPVALRNARQNRVTATVRFVEGDAAVLAPLLGPADLVLSNILRETNTSLLPVVAAALAPGGRAVFAGMEGPEAREFLAALARAGFRPVDETEDEGWWAVVAERA